MFWKIYLSYSPRTYRVSQRKVKIEQNVVVLFCEDIFWKMFSSLVMLQSTSCISHTFVYLPCSCCIIFDMVFVFSSFVQSDHDQSVFASRHLCLDRLGVSRMIYANVESPKVTQSFLYFKGLSSHKDTHCKYFCKKNPCICPGMHENLSEAQFLGFPMESQNYTLFQFQKSPISPCRQMSTQR